MTKRLLGMAFHDATPQYHCLKAALLLAYPRMAFQNVTAVDGSDQLRLRYDGRATECQGNLISEHGRTINPKGSHPEVERIRATKNGYKLRPDEH